MNTLSPIQLHALQRLAKDAGKVRGKLTVGTHDVDFGVQVNGSITVSGDQAFQSTSKPDAVTIAAILLGTYGVRKRKSIVAQLLDSSGIESAVNDDLRTLATELIDGLASSKQSTRRGSVTGELDCAVIDDGTKR